MSDVTIIKGKNMNSRKKDYVEFNKFDELEFVIYPKMFPDMTFGVNGLFLEKVLKQLQNRADKHVYTKWIKAIYCKLGDEFDSNRPLSKISMMSYDMYVERDGIVERRQRSW